MKNRFKKLNHFQITGMAFGIIASCVPINDLVNGLFGLLAFVLIVIGIAKNRREKKFTLK